MANLAAKEHKERKTNNTMLFILKTLFKFLDRIRPHVLRAHNGSIWDVHRATFWLLPSVFIGVHPWFLFLSCAPQDNKCPAQRRRGAKVEKMRRGTRD